MTNYQPTPIGAELGRLLARTIRDGVELDALPTRPGDLLYESSGAMPHKVYVNRHTLIIHFYTCPEGIYAREKPDTVKFLKQILRRLKRSKEPLSPGDVIHMSTPLRKRRGNELKR